MPNSISAPIVRRLQVVFIISIGLLIISLIALFYSMSGLIENAKLVNHTNEVRYKTENIFSLIKDAETGQRGFVITEDPRFLESYTGARAKVDEELYELKKLIIDNDEQRANLEEAQKLINIRFDQMQSVVDKTLKYETLSDADKTERYRQMLKGKRTMDDLRVVIERIKAKEQIILKKRSEELTRFISYTPFMVILAAIISILISVLSYLKIKADLDQRIRQQIEDEKKYHETTARIAAIENVTTQVIEGNLSARSTDNKDDELGKIASALNKMTSSLEANFKELSNANWLQTGKAKLSDVMRGENNIAIFSENLLNAISDYINAPIGTIYIIDPNLKFILRGSKATKNAPDHIVVGEGLTGQVIKSKKLTELTELPENYFHITSSTGNTQATSVVICPILYRDECIAIIELGFLRKPIPLEIEFLESCLESISVGINEVLNYIKMQELLEETQTQTEELQSQHYELESLNAELEAQSQKLQASEEELKVQQEELQQANQELEERSLMLEERNLEVSRKVEELALSTRYKSEFLANMSHELRTPLNSILLLSRLLSENNDSNLSSDQVEYARVIQSSGQGLLGLIDEILDLSKIEAGKMQIEFLQVPIYEIVDDLRSLFKPVANEKKLEFSINVDPGVPATIETDKLRLEQILRNLISNALKFTTKGSVQVDIRQLPDSVIHFSVKDTGIGIPEEKQQQIFEAFQQADGSTRRKYGGTGLGLSICRKLVKLLGGEIALSSKVNEGSDFSIYIPISQNRRFNIPNAISENTEKLKKTEKAIQNTDERKKFIATVIPAAIADDRDSIKHEDRIILIIEDDINFAGMLLEFTRKQGYKGIVSVRGDEGIKLAKQIKPTGILLDLQLPVKSGWEVMDTLKADPETRHIPVHIMSSFKMKNESIMKGAVDFVNKPVSPEQMQDIFQKIEYVLNRNPKKVLIVEENPMHAKALAYFLETFRINSEVKSNLAESISALNKKEIDCVIIDMGVPDHKAYDTLEEIKKTPGLESLPIIIFTGKSLSIKEEEKIKQYADSIIVKTAHSYQRILDEISLFLHLMEEKRQVSNSELKNLGALSEILNEKTVLIADDDVRNIFSLSKALENLKMNVITAIDGKEAMQKLEENPSIDIVLLDMMMPQMDGYETAKKIRENAVWKKLPVIAVTAKAMTGDRDKCINAGASDYITKPVDIDQLLSLLRVWLYEKA